MTIQELIPETLPLQGIQLIEASAGTGKTWTIAALYTRLILGHRDTGFDRPMTPDQILVVTFTDAATSELRDRIRARLADAAAYLKDESSELKDEFLKKLTANISPDLRRTLAYRLTIAADAMDDAAIYTIHGWCSRMLRQHAFDSGAPFELKIEGEEVELLNESVRDFWRTFFYALPVNECRLIAKIARSPEDLLSKIRSLLKETASSLEILKALSTPDPVAFRESLAGLAAIDQAAREAEAAARTCWHRHAAEIEGVIRKALQQKHINGNSYRSLDDRLHHFRGWSKGRNSIENPKWIPLFSAGGFNLTNTAQGIEPAHEVFNLMATWSEHLTASESLQLELHNRILCSAAFWIKRDFSGAKAQKARLDYNDLILKLHETLVENDNQRLAEIIRTQYPVILIDEFQDTDPLQYEIFDKIYGQGVDKTAWLMVGDPKQAIYGFRGADVYAYLRARPKSHGNEAAAGTYTLPCNYRSTESLVKATNRLFEQAEAAHERGAFNFPKQAEVQDRIGFSSVSAKGRSEELLIDGQPADALTFWYAANNDEPLAQKFYQREMADHCANEIANLINKAGMEPPQACFQAENQLPRRLQEADIAILVRDGKEASAVRDALSVRGLRSVYLSDRDSVYESREARDLLIWLRACLNPQNGRLIRAAMATQTMGLTYQDLEHLSGDEFALDQRIAEFTGYGDTWRNHGILPAIRQLLLEQKLPERLMVLSSGERTLTNLLHLAELLQTESSLRDGEHGLLRFLQESIDDELQEAKDNVLRLESDQGLIRVVTIHKAKGLEYPLVFLPFVCGYKETRTNRLTTYRYHVQEDPLHPLKLELVKGCQDAETAKANMEIERLQEELRLLYVAITRARHACWLGMAPLKIGNSRTPTLHKGAMGYLLSGGKAMDAKELKARIETCIKDLDRVSIVDIQPSEPINIQPQEANQAVPKEALDFNGEGFEAWWIASYSALKFSKGGAPSSAEDNSPDDPETAQDDQSREEEDSNHLADDSRNEKPPIMAKSIHDFHAGATHGVFLHDLLESAAKIGFDVLARDKHLLGELLDKTTRGRNYQDWNAVLAAWMTGFISQPFTADGRVLALSDLPAADCLTEMEFWFEAKGVWSTSLDAIFKKAALAGKERPALNPAKLNGILKGFIDLVFRHEGKYYVADYKSNKLGNDAEAYTETAIREALLEKRYDAQYVLYLLALHRYLKSRLGDDYDYDRDIGGAVYFFLRGVGGPAGGVHFDKPPRACIEHLDGLFQGTTSEELNHAGQ